ncbi:hypothetical protein AMS62_13145 [Bacillus sp. FJAT-18019]|nr:hypothetical protein AMS62_13145 [Bacillus sp. FJAT-18019]
MVGPSMNVSIEKGKVEVPSARRITDQRAKAIVNKLNEAVDVSSIKQIRTYFSPYFTDRFINTIIQNKGLAYDHQFTHLSQSAISYLDQNTATLSQPSLPDSEYGMKQTLYRRVTLVSTSQGWKVDSISFQLVDEVLNP